MCGHCGKVLQLARVGLVMHAVHESFGLFLGLPPADVGRNCAVGEQHELFDEFVGIL